MADVENLIDIYETRNDSWTNQQQRKQSRFLQMKQNAHPHFILRVISQLRLIISFLHCSQQNI